MHIHVIKTDKCLHQSLWLQEKSMNFFKISSLTSIHVLKIATVCEIYVCTYI